MPLPRRGDRRLVVVSNRLPLAARRHGEEWQLRQSSGGLVAALEPMLRARGGAWLGWPGAPLDGIEEALLVATRGVGYRVVPVEVPEKDRQPFYEGFANEIVWPLFHDFPSYCRFEGRSWSAYKRVNRLFAEATHKATHPSEVIWVHDYHLMDVGRGLRAAGWEGPVGFFLHIPWPSPDLFTKLPWRDEMLRSLFAYDLIGFQRPRDVRNFVACVTTILRRGVTVRFDGNAVHLGLDGATVRVAPFAIGIDAAAVERRARSAAVREKARLIRERTPDRTFLLGVDRVDYSKGIPQKLEAFRRFLERHPEWHERVSLMQILSPSRQGLERYEKLRADVERKVGEINGAYTSLGWVPVHYVHRLFDADELLAWYRTARACLVTPLKDGMNLVCKEYCAARVDRDGVLVLSEFAGAVTQLRDHALVVNPYDVDAFADAIRQALVMPRSERRRRMDGLRAQVHEHNVHAWANAFLAALEASTSGPPPPLPPRDAKRPRKPAPRRQRG